ncbi:MAG: aldo/keto reductase [Chloroflexi bacterium]|nr:aldo/keto reductase [Chloroflexota bacterium]MBV9598967.1 aldo/keto reductase [Chloroflexota bacterium]
MEYRQLGRTNLSVSILGLGSGGANRLGQRQDVERSESHSLVRHALDLGINFFDTAPAYGDSESLLGEALAGVPRESYVLNTKFTMRNDEPGAARASLEGSLRRLRTDYVDVISFHGLEPESYDSTLERFMPELQRAQRDGLTRFIGATERYEIDDAHEALERALTEDVFDVVMLGHNLISPGGLRAVLPLAQQKNVGVVVMCAVRTIIVNPDLLQETIRQWKDAGALAEDAVPDEGPLDWVLGPGVESLADAAYRFAVESPAVSTVLTGTANLQHLDDNVRSILSPPLPRATSERLRNTFIPANKSVLLHSFRRRSP